MEMPAYLVKVISTLKQNGYQAFVVGGCVRDILMGNEPADYDVATSATVQEIRSLFRKTVPTGEKHGTVAVLIDGFTVEVSTFKSYELGESSTGLEQDLSLRDFTVNAMAVDENGSLYDPFGGKQDLLNKIIKSPRNEPEQRFMEDPLRMLRAIRFCSTFGFSMYPDTYQAITKHYALLQKVAPERIRGELNLILLSGLPALGIRLMLETGLLQQVLPEAVAGFAQRSIRHNKNVFEHTLAVVEGVPSRLKVRLAALLHDIGKPNTFSIDENGVDHFYGHHLEGQKMVENILRRLKYDNKTIGDVSVLVGEHMSRYPKVRNSSFKKLINRVGKHNLEDLFDLQKADIMGAAPPYDFSELDDIQAGINQILSERLPMSIKDLAVKGDDLIEIGFEPGPELGRVLDLLLEEVLEDPDKNERAILLGLAAKNTTPV
ncbi:MAG: HD domain-containing protein [Desulfotomaculaceae bacterium]|nr:HD domain-containing protein [Desulfotomaculaceae bacterium]